MLKKSPLARRKKLTRSDALALGRLPKAERNRRRRQMQKRRATQAWRERKKAQALAARRPKPYVWPVFPDLPPAPASAAEPQDPDDGLGSGPRPKRPRRRARRRRQAVRAEPMPAGRVHGQNRGGESARSWGERGSATRVPVDVDEWLREEF